MASPQQSTTPDQQHQDDLIDTIYQLLQTQGNSKNVEATLRQELQETKEKLQNSQKQNSNLHENLQRLQVTEGNLRQDMKRRTNTETELRQQLRQQNDIETELRQQLKRQTDTETELRQQLKRRTDAETELSQELNRQVNIERDLRQQLREAIQQAQQREPTSSPQNQAHWVVLKEEINVTQEVIGKGGWGEVRAANFRGLKVAAKCLHDLIISDYNISIFAREMEIAARVRHPNLLQFIGATKEGNPIILSELMPTSLRRELEKSPLTRSQIVRIAQDICAALNYLHLWKPHPILHRDVSSPNVLLEPSGKGQWKAKLSDYGSANLAHQISTTVGPGSPAYSAPEAPFPDRHSPAMDVYSFGVLLMEMIVRKPPPPTTVAREVEVESVPWPSFKQLIQKCILREYQNRPSTGQVLIDLTSI